MQRRVGRAASPQRRAHQQHLRVAGARARALALVRAKRTRNANAALPSSRGLARKEARARTPSAPASGGVAFRAASGMELHRPLVTSCTLAACGTRSAAFCACSATFAAALPASCHALLPVRLSADSFLAPSSAALALGQRGASPPPEEAEGA